MYCKHCGGPLELTDAKCRNCGARIDFLDGGQSFFEDNDLKEWSNGVAPVIPIPRTESLAGDDERKTSALNNQPQMQMPAATSIEKSSTPKKANSVSHPKKNTSNIGKTKKKPQNRHGKKKKKKKWLSRQNKLIAVCIVFTLAIVMVIVGIWKITEIWSGDKNTGPSPSPTTAAESIELENSGEQPANTGDTEGIINIQHTADPEAM